GMVLKPEPIFECAEKLGIAAKSERATGAKETVVLLSPQGEMFDQRLAQELASLDRIVLICGRYEGVDERVAEFLADREISVGNYVLSGGELPAAIITDAVVRLIPGALGNEASARQESFSESQQGFSERARAGYTQQTGPSPETDLEAALGPDSTCASGGLLDYPHYTRPADYRGMKVPEVLVSGNHSEIRRW